MISNEALLSFLFELAFPFHYLDLAMGFGGVGADLMVSA